jgi:hypothetical protein
MVFVLNFYTITTFKLSVINNITTGRSVIKDFKDQIFAFFYQEQLRNEKIKLKRIRLD